MRLARTCAPQRHGRRKAVLEPLRLLHPSKFRIRPARCQIETKVHPRGICSPWSDLHPERVDKGAQIVAATRAAMAEGFKTILATGVDCTICTVAFVLRGGNRVTDIPPLGTFDCFARSLDLTLEKEAAAKVIVEAEARRGCVKTRPLDFQKNTLSPSEPF
jgi:hypothetical protein